MNVLEAAGRLTSAIDGLRAADASLEVATASAHQVAEAHEEMEKSRVER